MSTTPTTEPTTEPISNICERPDCEQNVEANPTLYVSLDGDGEWSISGVSDDSPQIACEDGHPQSDGRLFTTLSAFLESQFPGGTWASSGPKS